ncbi:DUF4224 domain-containing protein [Paraburkholderia domus]|uniref:DUF4224 domain-containing protein n=1 Tax=Paraburkholderia domus TaxID=2793075 RepID=UPI001B180B5F|nr:DUF4224 domain-containing protein [Paraburkholderia domus]CAE6697047.1 hypothetical protein R75483_00648 [Paraburkholderia domus]
MSEHLMAPADLERITGYKRKAEQVSWFRRTFGIEPITAANGAIIMSWAIFDSLQARKNGLVSDASMRERPALRPVHA